MHSSLPFLADIGDSLPRSGWFVAAAIVVIGLLVLGLSDLMRFSPRRVWAIGGVCFRESIRRRVLWIIPLAILGVVVVAQLQKAIDEQDILRQTTKFCLFASGLVVVLTAIILACTNIPKEIETRVIYLVVTKPATRLELIIGKILGFSRVSAVILILMGAFSYTYLRIRAWSQEQEVVSRLATDSAISDAERNKLEHYRDGGLLTAHGYLQPEDAQVMAAIDPASPTVAALPTPKDSVRSIFGDSEEELLFPFKMDHPKFFGGPIDPEGNSVDEGIGKTGLLIGVRIKWHRYGPENVEPGKTPGVPQAPLITVDLLDHTGYNLIGGVTMYNPRYPGAKDAHTSGLPVAMENTMDTSSTSIDQSKLIWAYVPPSQVGVLFSEPTFYVHIFGMSHNVQYFVDASSVFVAVSPPVKIGEYAPEIALDAMPQPDQVIWPDAGPDGRPLPPQVRGRIANRGGQELVGKPVSDAHVPFAVFRFRGAVDAAALAQASGGVPIQMEAPIEHGGDLEDKSDASTNVDVYVRSVGGAQPGAVSQPIELKLENKQPAFAELPAAAMNGGDFDVMMRCNSPGHLLDLDADSLSIVTSREPFVWNLAKSLFILWMLTVLVISIAVLTSTFLSWPIAVVLTVVLLLGHWAVTQVADVTDKTLGRSVATDMGLTDPSKAEAVANSVNTLTSVLQTVGAVLPDINHFSAIDEIERGTIVSSASVTEALGMLAAFALPAAVLGYLVLKKKEVAP